MKSCINRRQKTSYILTLLIYLIKIVCTFLPRYPRPQLIPCTFSPYAGRKQIVFEHIYILLRKLRKSASKETKHRLCGIVLRLYIGYRSDKLDKRMEKYLLCGIHEIRYIVFCEYRLHIIAIRAHITGNYRNVPVLKSLFSDQLTDPSGGKGKLLL